MSLYILASGDKKVLYELIDVILDCGISFEMFLSVDTKLQSFGTSNKYQNSFFSNP